MPFLGVVMAFVSRIMTARVAGEAITSLNVVLWLGAVGVALYRLRPLLAPGWWWVAAFALLSFAPMMSSVWWKQFNVIALVLAAGGFDLVRRRHPTSGALAIGLSVSVKPLAFLLPLVMVARRDTRRVGAYAIGWVIGLDVAAQALLAWRAHVLATLNPVIGIRNLVDKTSNAGNIFLCHPLNFSPASTLCRLNGGFHHWTLQRVAVVCMVALLGAWVIDALRGRSASSWELFAFACPLSVMLSPLAWSHYQIMLAPLFLLLLVRFARDGASFGAWAGLAVAFVLASIMWEPYGTIISSIRGQPANPLQPTFVEQYAQLAQYVLVLTGILWFARHPAIVHAPRDSLAEAS
jgi:Glycosyltransferase family 87